MAHRADAYMKVIVTFEQRPDGGLRASSDDVPGFVLSGLDHDEVIADVIPALESLFLHNRGMKVTFAPVKDVHSVLEEQGIIDSPKDREVREYVTPMIQAA